MRHRCALSTSNCALHPSPSAPSAPRHQRRWRGGRCTCARVVHGRTLPLAEENESSVLLSATRALPPGGGAAGGHRFPRRVGPGLLRPRRVRDRTGETGAVTLRTAASLVRRFPGSTVCRLPQLKLPYINPADGPLPLECDGSAGDGTSLSTVCVSASSINSPLIRLELDFHDVDDIKTN